MNGADGLSYPKGEHIWVGYYNGKHELRFIITSKDSRDYYFLYEFVNGRFNKLGKAKSPKELEERFDISVKVGE